MGPAAVHLPSYYGIASFGTNLASTASAWHQVSQPTFTAIHEAATVCTAVYVFMVHGQDPLVMQPDLVTFDPLFSSCV